MRSRIDIVIKRYIAIGVYTFLAIKKPHKRLCLRGFTESDRRDSKTDYASKNPYFTGFVALRFI